MDAIALLKADHKTVETLFRRFEQAGRNAKKLKRSLVDRIVRELAVHSVIEEQVLYPTARAKARQLTETVLQALEEHHVAKWLLKELEDLPPDAERFEAKVKVLIENVRAHIREEERVLLPQLRKACTPAELREMAELLTTARKTAPTRPHPRAPDTPPGNMVAGAMSAVLDTGRDAIDAARHAVGGLLPKATRGKSRRKKGAEHPVRGNGTAQGTGAEAHTLM
jgi:hemerythrin superfamily protein